MNARTSQVLVKDRKIFEWLNEMEKEINVSLATILEKAVTGLKQISSNWNQDKFITWLDTYQAQLVCLSIQIVWCEMLDAALDKGGGDALKHVQEHVDRTLTCMADTVLRFQPPILRFVSLSCAVTRFPTCSSPRAWTFTRLRANVVVQPLAYLAT